MEFFTMPGKLRLAHALSEVAAFLRFRLHMI
jgi:hypothetical protein